MKYYIYIIVSIIVAGCTMIQNGTETTITISTTQYEMCDATINESLYALNSVDKFNINTNKKHVIVKHDIAKLTQDRHEGIV